MVKKTQPGDRKDCCTENREKERSLAGEASEGTAFPETAGDTVKKNYDERPKSHHKQRKRVSALLGIIAVRDLLRTVLLIIFIIASLVTDKPGVCELAIILW
ncbi:hypothetical protein BH24ACT22_BH24ACT22_21720 [soil metagenome]